MSEIGLQMDEISTDERKKILKYACNCDGKQPIVKIKDFKIKLSWFESNIGEIKTVECTQEGNSEKIKNQIKEWMKDVNSVKIFPLIINSNIYLLAVLAALSKTLSCLIEEGKTDNMDKIEIDFLIGKKLIEHSKKLIKPSFDKNYRRIIPDLYDDNLETITEINFLELKSLLNILIVSFEIKGVNLRKIINKVHHSDIEQYRKENVESNEKINQSIEKWTTNKIDTLSDDEMDLRIKEISLNKNYNITNELLKIVVSHLQSPKSQTLQHSPDNKSGDKFILIAAAPMCYSIKEFIGDSIKNNYLNMDKSRLDNIMFISYTNPTDPEYPEIIQKPIPSYLTILSQYINSEGLVYAIDEYFHSKMVHMTKSKKFHCEKFHEEIIYEMQKGEKSFLKEKPLEKTLNEYATQKMNALKSLDAIPTDRSILKYIKKQKKELEVINDGFLSVQNDILEQLKLIL